MSTNAAAGPISAPMVADLEQAWAKIRARHGEIPAAVVVLGAGSIGAPAAGLRLGHFAAMRWHHDTTQLPEVFVGGEGIAHGPADVLATLLHKAAHALAHVRRARGEHRPDLPPGRAGAHAGGRAGAGPSGPWA